MAPVKEVQTLRNFGPNVSVAQRGSLLQDPTYLNASDPRRTPAFSWRIRRLLHGQAVGHVEPEICVERISFSDGEVE